MAGLAVQVRHFEPDFQVATAATLAFSMGACEDARPDDMPPMVAVEVTQLGAYGHQLRSAFSRFTRSWCARDSFSHTTAATCESVSNSAADGSRNPCVERPRRPPCLS